MAKMIRITAKRDGFRRAGIAHPAVPTDHAADRFSKEEREALDNDPMLIVQDVEVPDAEDKKQPAAKAGAKPSSPAGK